MPDKVFVKKGEFSGPSTSEPGCSLGVTRDSHGVCSRDASEETWSLSCIAGERGSLSQLGNLEPSGFEYPSRSLKHCVSARLGAANQPQLRESLEVAMEPYEEESSNGNRRKPVSHGGWSPQSCRL